MIVIEYCSYIHEINSSRLYYSAFIYCIYQTELRVTDPAFRSTPPASHTKVYCPGADLEAPRHQRGQARQDPLGCFLLWRPIESALGGHGGSRGWGGGAKERKVNTLNRLKFLLVRHEHPLPLAIRLDWVACLPDPLKYPLLFGFLWRESSRTTASTEFDCKLMFSTSPPTPTSCRTNKMKACRV